MPAPVTLHIYDVGDQKAVSKVNQLLKPIGTGAFHGAVEVYGREEWSYGYIDEGTGVFSNAPKGCPMHTYRESVSMGETALSEEEVAKLIEEMKGAWPGVDYDLLRCNCCNFSDAFCVKLGVGNVPKWVTNLAGAGATLEDDGFKAVHSKAQAAAIVAAAKADEIDAKYQIRSKTDAKAKDLAKFSKEMDEKYGESRRAPRAPSRGRTQSSRTLTTSTRSPRRARRQSSRPRRPGRASWGRSATGSAAAGPVAPTARTPRSRWTSRAAGRDGLPLIVRMTSGMGLSHFQQPDRQGVTTGT
ncbi:unnamed protein product [Prorocentrum cordatum]|uniref:PPPDE domain-containing protein n=1 Tax=Prorocentrum cordatum TaxID=2364126 RepID=A0ABN9WT24_9DINO|nr:unnamed protein product [Polarella glacialis]